MIDKNVDRQIKDILKVIEHYTHEDALNVLTLVCNIIKTRYWEIQQKSLQLPWKDAVDFTPTRRKG